MCSFGAKIGAFPVHDPNRRPILDEERPYLAALGSELHRLREISGLSQSDLAYAATITPRHLQYLESGKRRTRRSTLARLVTVIVEVHPQFGAADVMLAELVELAGPALAPESPYKDRIDRRRNRRAKRYERLLEQTTYREHAWYRSRSRKDSGL